MSAYSDLINSDAATHSAQGSHWGMDQLSGNLVADWSLGGYFSVLIPIGTGIAYGDPTIYDCFGTAISFDGNTAHNGHFSTSTYVMVANSKLTIEFLFKTQDVVNRQYIINNGVYGGFGNLVVSIGDPVSGLQVMGVAAENGGGSILTDPIIAADTWYHIALVLDNQTPENDRIYINGVSSATANTLAANTLFCGGSSFAEFRVSGQVAPGTPGAIINGALDELSLVEYPFSASEIAGHYAAILSCGPSVDEWWDIIHLGNKAVGSPAMALPDLSDVDDTVDTGPSAQDVIAWSGSEWNRVSVIDGGGP